MPSLSTAVVAGSLAILAIFPLASSKACPPLGPVLPAPTSASESNFVKKATAGLTTALQSELESQLKASAISIGVKSIHEDDLLFNYHFTPPMQSGLGTTVVDENTIYRVGSISKLLPALALLQNGNVSMDDSVTKYIPELRNARGSSAIEFPTWDDITVGALASHLAGLGTDGRFEAI
jgi:CubicO group peptidase (beta-lactamase class C family)